MPEVKKQIEKRELKMTGTLIIISLCYIVFVGPIYFCTLLGVTGPPYMVCYILYWFQVRI